MRLMKDEGIKPRFLKPLTGDRAIANSVALTIVETEKSIGRCAVNLWQCCMPKHPCVLHSLRKLQQRPDVGQRHHSNFPMNQHRWRQLHIEKALIRPRPTRAFTYNTNASWLVLTPCTFQRLSHLSVNAKRDVQDLSLSKAIGNLTTAKVVVLEICLSIGGLSHPEKLQPHALSWAFGRRRDLGDT